ncbi:jg523, partial [Pararge aegeria aegeria]
MCKSKISFQSGVSNLTKHVQRKHLAVNLVAREETEQQPQEISPQLPPSSQPSTSATVTIPISTNPPARRYPPISAFLRRDCNKIKKDIDDHIMNLFIWDMQPFTIVEDKGFRDLIKFAFSNYVLPTRKYFANNLLPGQYEAVKTATMAS